MSEGLPDDVERGPLFDMMRREGMAQGVGRGVGNAGFLEIFVDEIANGPTAERPLEFGQEERLLVDLGADGEIGLEGATGFVVEGDAAFLAPLPMDPQQADVAGV